MSYGRHSFVSFYPSDWIGGTARMTRTQRAVYFDVCCYIWDKAEPCPETELPLMLGDIEGWKDVIEVLIAAGKLIRTADGIVNDKAIHEASKAYALWLKKSEGGKRGAAKTNTPDGTPDGTPGRVPEQSRQDTGGTPVAEPEPEPEPTLLEVTTVTSTDKPTKQKRGSRIPDDWKPNDDDRATARAEGFNEQQIDRLGACFRDYWSGVPGSKGTKLTWSGTWRNYVRGPVAKSQAGGNGYNGGGGGAQEKIGGTVGAYLTIKNRWRSEDNGGGV